MFLKEGFSPVSVPRGKLGKWLKLFVGPAGECEGFLVCGRTQLNFYTISLTGYSNGWFPWRPAT